MSTQNDGATAEITFDLAGQKVSVATKDLDAIRQSVIAYLRQSNEEQRDAFIAELETAPFRIDENHVGRVGSWLLEQDDDRLRLVRHPPSRTGIMYLFYATMKTQDGRWVVEDFAYQRVQGR